MRQRGEPPALRHRPRRAARRGSRRERARRRLSLRHRFAARASPSNRWKSAGRNSRLCERMIERHVGEFSAWLAAPAGLAGATPERAPLHCHRRLRIVEQPHPRHARQRARSRAGGARQTRPCTAAHPASCGSRCKSSPPPAIAASTEGRSGKAARESGAGLKGLFTREIQDAALLAGEIDVAVHSLQRPARPAACRSELAAVLERAATNDVLISNHRAKSRRASSRGARIGTSSVRRRRQLRMAAPGVSR